LEVQEWEHSGLDKLVAPDKDKLPPWCIIDDGKIITEFRFGKHFDLFYKHYKDCLMMLEFKKGKCPNWIITYIAAFELTISDQEQPLWIKNMIFPNCQSNIDTVYSPQQLSAIAVLRRDSSDA